jgi:hypothetical protein
MFVGRDMHLSPSSRKVLNRIRVCVHPDVIRSRTWPTRVPLSSDRWLNMAFRREFSDFTRADHAQYRLCRVYNARGDAPEVEAKVDKRQGTWNVFKRFLQSFLGNDMRFGVGCCRAPQSSGSRPFCNLPRAYFFTPRTASFAALATRNLTTVLAGILIFCCVFGLKPERAFLFCFTSLPKPGKTNSPFFFIAL